MSTTDFTPERSAAIRQLLIDTVENEPRRRKRLQILLTSVLSGAAIALAGGTAALALTGVLHFGGGDTPPAPVPTPTVTPTPTPTPTPSPTPTRPIVQSAPVQPHDVDSLPATPRWSLDLPGDTACTLVSSYTLSDGRAVYLSGVRPKEYEGFGDCASETTDHIAVTLVDTENGRALWTREWSSSSLMGPLRFAVLGTSGRALLTSTNLDAGPHEVLELTTGQTAATFATGSGVDPRTDIVPLPGDSGDVIVVHHTVNSDGRTTAPDVVERVDPRDATHPRWSQQSGPAGIDVFPPLVGASAVPVQAVGFTSGVSSTAMLDLETGETHPVAGVATGTPLSAVYLLADADSLYAYDGSGTRLWTRSNAGGPVLRAVETPAQIPGTISGTQRSDTGDLVVLTADSIELTDQVAGTARWSAPASVCGGQDPRGFGRVVFDPAREVLTFEGGRTTCTLSAAGGSSVDAPDIARTWQEMTGLTNAYVTSGDPGTLTAYRLADGARLWTRAAAAGDPSSFASSETWAFVGGYLVSTRKNHLESVG